MHLFKSLICNGEEYGLKSDNTFLELYAPSRAIFTVLSDKPLSGVVELLMGYGGGNMHVVFSGYIEHSATVDSRQQRLRCRELCAVLDAAPPIALRHPTLQDVCNAYHEHTGLAFVLPEKPYATTPIPHFHNLGDGFAGLTAAGVAYSIPQYIWQQQSDKKVFVGSWKDSRWPDKPQEVDERWFKNVAANGTRTMTTLPPVRPGCLLNGEIVSTMELQGSTMTIKTIKNFQELKAYA